jgi:hypothetical protein
LSSHRGLSVKKLAAHVDEPVKSGECTLILRKMEDATDRKMKGALRYRVHMDPELKPEAKAAHLTGARAQGLA